MEGFGPAQNGNEKYGYVSCRLWYGPTVLTHRTTSSFFSYLNKTKNDVSVSAAWGFNIKVGSYDMIMLVSIQKDNSQTEQEDEADQAFESV